LLGDVLSVLSGGRAQLKPDVEASTAGLMREVFHHDGTTRHFRTEAEIAECGGERLGANTEESLNKAANGIPIWLDYTSLRQCVNDFSLPRLDPLVGSMPVFVAAPQTTAYTDRTFCVFELYLCYWHRRIRSSDLRKMLVAQNFATNEEGMARACGKVDTKHAQARSATHKGVIDKYVNVNVKGGFGGLDEMVKKAFLDSARQRVD
jgi:hypothetical protein